MILIILFRAVIAAIGAFKQRSLAAKAQSLCNECASAHIQFGARGQRAISCTYGGGIRTITLDVLFCTDYRSRRVPIRAAIGFVQEITPAE